jgi:hypothetical protein
MPRVGFERTTQVSERAKTVHALDRAAIVIVLLYSYTGGKFKRAYIGFLFRKIS